MSQHVKLEAAGLSGYFEDGSNGYFWPVLHNSDSSHGWVARVDDVAAWEAEHDGTRVSSVYENDDLALAAALAELVRGLGRREEDFVLMPHLRVGWAVPVGCLSPYPYIDIDEAFFLRGER